MDITRTFWVEKIHTLWKKKPIVWLAGVRRSGKTTLAEHFHEAKYLNCDLPSVQDELKDPEYFYKNLKNEIIIFDEIHQLDEASLILKIGADLYKDKKILATGSSTLLASKKFKDSLTGRKSNIHFVPVLVSELDAFHSTLDKRLLKGGLPPALLASTLDMEFYAEWLDSFYARDIQELFAIEKRNPFLKTLEYLLIQNSHQLEVNELSRTAGISRPTAIKYLEALELTKAITLVRPFSSNASKEIVSQPKVYGFDTGFVCYAQRIKELRNTDKGKLLENLTLETYQSLQTNTPMQYWRTKNKNEVDFIINTDPKKPIAVECKWQEKEFSPHNIKLFRELYPNGKNIVVTGNSTQTKEKNMGGCKIDFVSIFDLEFYFKKIL